MGQDAEGRLTIRAVRYDGAVNLDGNLDEDVYQTPCTSQHFHSADPD